MAKILQAVAKYGPRIELKPTIGLKDVAERTSKTAAQRAARQKQEG